MNTSINDALAYFKTNWKHVLFGLALAYVGQQYGPLASSKFGAILGLFGLH